jgi:hypothetical protein
MKVHNFGKAAMGIYLGVKEFSKNPHFSNFEIS